MNGKTSERPSLRVGTAKVDISPAAETQMAGAVGVRRKAKALLDPLFARALVLHNGESRLCLVSGDLTIVETVLSCLRELLPERG